LRDWSYDLPFLLRTLSPYNDVVVVGLDDAVYRAMDRDQRRKFAVKEVITAQV